MISQADKDKIKKLGLDLDAIIAAHNATTEVAVTIPDGEVLTADQLALRDKNTLIAGEKDIKKEAEASAFKMAVAEINKHTGLTITPDKDGRFAEIGKAVKVELDKTTDDKLKTVNQQVTDLIARNETLTAEATTAKATVDNVKFQYDQFKHLPANRTKTMTEGEILTLMQGRGVEPKADGVYRNGVLMVDEVTKAALPHAKAYEIIATEFKLIAEAPAGAAGGRGGGNSGLGGTSGAKARNYSEAETKWLADNPSGNIISPAFNAFVAEQAKDNPTFTFE